MLKKILFSFLTVLALVSLSFIPIGKEEAGEIEFYLLSGDIHIGFVLPVKNEVFDWETFIDQGEFKERPSEWLEFGWGDRQFYFEMPTWEHFTFRLALDALLWPDSAVMHVEYLKTHPMGYMNVRKVKVSKETYQKIVESIRASFILEKGHPILINGKGYGPNDNFYEGVGSYSVIRTCNIWTSDILGQAGLKRPVWSPTKYGLEFVWKN